MLGVDLSRGGSSEVRFSDGKGGRNRLLQLPFQCRCQIRLLLAGEIVGMQP